VREKSGNPGKSGRAKVRTFEIEVARADEGVWTATSVAVPGLNIEGDSFEQAIAEARVWAPELLRANGVLAADEAVELVFSREGERLAVE
jgi:hypothetical protein